jgi:hypothetical protein
MRGLKYLDSIFRVTNLANAISVQRLGDFTGENESGDLTAEARRAASKVVLIKNLSDLCVLCTSAVNTFSQETQNSHWKGSADFREKLSDSPTNFQFWGVCAAMNGTIDGSRDSRHVSRFGKSPLNYPR